MALAVPPVPDRSGRGEVVRTAAERAGARTTLQSGRLDVLVHLRALQALDAGTPDRSDWVTLSRRFSTTDGEPPIQRERDGQRHGPVTLAPGGKVLHGTTSAAVALYAGTDIDVVIENGRPVDRSQEALELEGIAPSVLRSLALTLLATDPSAALVVLEHGAAGHDEAAFELGARYDRFYTEIDHLDSGLAASLGLTASGSTTILVLRTATATIVPVLAGLPAVLLAATGPSALDIGRQLLGETRTRTSSRDHDRLLRRVRLRRSVGQRLERAVGR